MKQRRSLMRSSTSVGVHPSRKGKARHTLLIIILLFCYPSLVVAQGRVEEYLRSQAKVGTFGVYAFEVESGQSLASFNEEAPLKPASVLKLLTSYTALHRLGAEYRFFTEFFVVPAGTVANLHVRGGGDPDLTLEAAWLAARALREKGLREIGDIVLDDTRFLVTRDTSGNRAYEAGSGALSFNFNSIQFSICPGAKGKEARVTVEPREAGVTVSGSIGTGGGGSPGVESTSEPLTYRLSGSIPSNGGCLSLYRSVSHPTLYFGRTFREILRSLGIVVRGKIREGGVPDGREPIYVAESKPLHDILGGLNRYSNNFVAEQLLNILGEERGLFSRAKGLAVLETTLHSLGVPPSEFHLEDASGLSHANRISPRALGRVMRAALADFKIAAEFEASLSRSGESGTLKRRRFGAAPLLVRGKTGSLDGVSSLAGVLPLRSGKQAGFVILGNGIASKGSALVVEERVVELLAENN